MPDLENETDPEAIALVNDPTLCQCSSCLRWRTRLFGGKTTLEEEFFNRQGESDAEV